MLDKPSVCSEASALVNALSGNENANGGLHGLVVHEIAHDAPIASNLKVDSFGPHRGKPSTSSEPHIYET